MQYRHLGRTGIRVSELSIGSWVTFKNQVDVNAAVEIMAAAYDHGVNFYDNAEVYAGEQVYNLPHVAGASGARSASRASVTAMSRGGWRSSLMRRSRQGCATDGAMDFLQR